MTDVFINDHERTPRGNGEEGTGTCMSGPSLGWRRKERWEGDSSDRNGLINRKCSLIFIMGCVEKRQWTAGAVHSPRRAASRRVNFEPREPGMQDLPASAASRASDDSISRRARFAQGADDIVIARGGVEEDGSERRHRNVEGRRMVHENSLSVKFSGHIS